MSANAAFAAIPAELRALPQWVCWRVEIPPDKVKPAKVPYTPGRDTKALTTKPATWRSFSAACASAARYDGIGFVFKAGGGIFGFDADHLRDKATGVIAPEARVWLDRFATYAEVSPGGEGVHAIGYGVLPGDGKKRPPFEVYDQERYFTVTGARLAEYPDHLTDANGALTALWQELATAGGAIPDAPPTAAGSSPLSDQDVLRKAMDALNGTKFRALWAGDTASYERDHSRADQALCNSLAFWCARDANQMDRLFRQSGLMRAKWDSKRGRSTYGAGTIAEACRITREVYGLATAPTPVRSTPLRVVPPMEDPPPHGPGPAEPDHVDPGPTRYELTDLGNGQRFADAHRGALTYVRYGEKTGSWRAWDTTRWMASVEDELLARAGRLTRAMAQDGLNTWDTDEGKALLKHAMKSQAEGRLSAMVNMAKNGLGSWAYDYDTDPWLLNCPNGTLDLTTGRLRPQSPSDLISKTTGVPYDPFAVCPTWDTFLRQIMPDDEVRSFLQIAAGYSLTGSTREQCLFFCHGTGKNGKSTFLTALRHICGDYATTTRTETFMVKKTDGGASSDVADLLGARIVTASEPDEGKRIAESLLKEMTGQDALKARFLYKEFFNFTPSFKIWFMANHKPTIRGTDDGIWRRIRLIPFTKQILPDAMDKKLPEKLRAESPGILRWAVEGCAKWLESELPLPGIIEQATAGYRREMDVLASFLEERCDFLANGEVIKASVYAVYRAWANEAQEYVMSHSMFSRRMLERGIQDKVANSQRFWLGIRLRSERDDGL